MSPNTLHPPPSTLHPPRWLHVWAILTVIPSAFLLAVGTLVTTYRVGMADPDWPTAPWHLLFINWQEPSNGFLIEHTHRLGGYTIGGMAAVLALGLWFTDPRGWARWLGSLSFFVLLTSYGQFHRELMKQIKAPEITIPATIVWTMAGSFGVMLLCALAGFASGTRGTGLRFLGMASLVAVMIQGLLGGFRVRLNALVGTDLAEVHGVFAQFVFSMLVAVAVLTARRTTKPDLLPNERLNCRRIATLLVCFVVVQLLWGAQVRHNPTPVFQRLHLITAFVVLATAVWLIKTAHESTTSWNRLNKACLLLAVFLVFQIILGVEAWMGKFAGGVLPDLQKISLGQAIVRTAHVLVGTGILATSVGLFLLTRRTTAVVGADRIYEPVSFVTANTIGDAS